MKKMFAVLFAAAMTMSLSISAFAAGWNSNQRGWWYDQGNGAYPASAWCWIDGNSDGVAECYYFDEEGYLVTSADVGGYYVNESGQWSVNGFVQTRNFRTAANTGAETAQSIVGTFEGYYTAGQGKTGVTLTVYEDLGELWGEFEFYNFPGMNNAKEGSFAVHITENGNGTYRIQQDHWIDQPSGYAMVSWDNVELKGGRLSSDQGRNGGRILRCEKR